MPWSLGMWCKENKNIIVVNLYALSFVWKWFATVVEPFFRRDWTLYQIFSCKLHITNYTKVFLLSREGRFRDQRRLVLHAKKWYWYGRICARLALGISPWWWRIICSRFEFFVVLWESICEELHFLLYGSASWVAYIFTVYIFEKTMQL